MLNLVHFHPSLCPSDHGGYGKQILWMQFVAFLEPKNHIFFNLFKIIRNLLILLETNSSA
jgi:hypothetical protein